MLALMLNPNAPLFAAMEAATFDPTSWLVNYGIAGVVIALVIMGRFRTKQEVDGLKEQLVAAQKAVLDERAANSALVTQITQHTLPTLERLGSLVNEMPKTSESDLLSRLDVLTRKIEDVQRKADTR